MTEDRDFLTRQVIAMIEEEGAELIGAVPCPQTHLELAHEDFVRADIRCNGCKAVI
jgi:hypothetical protein